jgi:hypothetical protein
MIAPVARPSKFASRLTPAGHACPVRARAPRSPNGGCFTDDVFLPADLRSSTRPTRNFNPTFGFEL